MDPKISIFRLTEIVTTAVTADGTAILVDVPADANLFVAIAAANRDPAHFNNPDGFDIGRSNARDHLSFGGGAHLCLGAPLARLEARVVFEELTRAAPDLALVADQAFDFMPIVGFRGPRSLRVTS